MARLLGYSLVISHR